LCDLNNFDVILGNTFLDAYKVYILRNENKLKIHTKVGFKLMHLDAEYNCMLVKIGVNLVALVNELEFHRFFVLMSLRVSKGKPKPQGARQPPTCILDSFNKFLEVLTNELPDALPPCREVDHKIEVVLSLALPFKAFYRLNKKEHE
jgi:hypothetical protein